MQRIIQIALVVNDYDEAIDFYTSKLKFELIEDSVLTEAKGWVRVAPKGSPEFCLLLAKAATDEQRLRIGNQTGGRVFLFMHTNDFEGDYQNLINQNIQIIRGPVKEVYGTVCVFEDLYGNLWDLIEPIS